VKILYHLRTRSRDGQDVHITEMIRALRGLGHEVVVVAPGATDAAEFGDDGGAVATLKRFCPRFVYELMELAYSLVVYRRLARAIRTHRPDVLYERYNLFLPAGVWAKRRFRLPMLLEVNGPLYEERAANDGIALSRLARWSQRFCWRGADYVLPVTEALAKHVERYGVDRARIVVIPNGIDPEQFHDGLDSAEAKRRLGLDGRVVLGFTGFVRDWHGLDKVIDLLANAVARSAGPASHLLIVGDGPARASLERQATAAGVGDRMTITGVVPRERIAAHIAAFDVALQPASVEYASPLKLFEYMALGRAIVAPAQPNIMEILTDGDDGLLFDPREPGALANAVDRLCRDPALRERIGDAARKTIRARRLTWRDNAARVVELSAAMRHGALQ
jgi:glycosyltransferase involved in cell wall biosynthesis